jgi:hypothetical protein
VIVDGAHFDELCADMDAALARVTAPLEPRPELWHVGPAGKWSVGQIVDHVATSAGRYADWFDEALVKLRGGLLPPPGRRWPHQALIAALIIHRGSFPSGGRSPQLFLPSDLPRRDEVMSRLERAARRHREIGSLLSAPDRDRLWVRSALFGPISLPQVVRLHAVHARHHAKQVARIAASH